MLIWIQLIFSLRWYFSTYYTCWIFLIPLIIWYILIYCWCIQLISSCLCLTDWWWSSASFSLWTWKKETHGRVYCCIRRSGRFFYIIIPVQLIQFTFVSCLNIYNVFLEYQGISENVLEHLQISLDYSRMN
jgi:hypothetical protein